MLNEFGQVVSRPFREEVPTKTMLLYIVLYVVAAWAIYDMLRILSTWVKSQ